MNAASIWRETAALKERYKEARPSELARAVGVSVRYRELGSLKGLYICFEGMGHIIINARLSDEEREMVAAHELGHDRLHRGACEDASFMDSLLFDAKGRAEFEANLFAAELMIPDESVLFSPQDCYTLAKTLCVHPQLMLFKLYSLNCRGHNIPMPEECRADFWGRRL